MNIELPQLQVFTGDIPKRLAQQASAPQKWMEFVVAEGRKADRAKVNRLIGQGAIDLTVELRPAQELPDLEGGFLITGRLIIGGGQLDLGCTRKGEGGTNYESLVFLRTEDTEPYHMAELSKGRRGGELDFRRWTFHAQQEASKVSSSADYLQVFTRVNATRKMAEDGLAGKLHGMRLVPRVTIKTA